MHLTHICTGVSDYKQSEMTQSGLMPQSGTTLSKLCLTIEIEIWWIAICVFIRCSRIKRLTNFHGFYLLWCLEVPLTMTAQPAVVATTTPASNAILKGLQWFSIINRIVVFFFKFDILFSVNSFVQVNDVFIIYVYTW